MDRMFGGGYLHYLIKCWFHFWADEDGGEAVEFEMGSIQEDRC